MTPEIVRKLQAEIDEGITRESQVVYLLAGIRKIIEQEDSSERYPYLEFHCNWALHSKLDRGLARRILSFFNSSHLKLAAGDSDPNAETETISKMEKFQKELSEFLRAHSVTDFSSTDSWPKFLYLYARVVEDSPLVISGNNSAHVREVVISVELAKKLQEGQKFFKVSWNIGVQNASRFIFESPPFSHCENGGGYGKLVEPLVVKRWYPAQWVRPTPDLSRLAKLRDKGWSMKRISDHTGVSRTTVWRFLNGSDS